MNENLRKKPKVIAQLEEACTVNHWLDRSCTDWAQTDKKKPSAKLQSAIARSFGSRPKLGGSAVPQWYRGHAKDPHLPISHWASVKVDWC